VPISKRADVQMEVGSQMSEVDQVSSQQLKALGERKTDVTTGPVIGEAGKLHCC